jgi:2'-5' RNA ligase
LILPQYYNTFILIESSIGEACGIRAFIGIDFSRELKNRIFEFQQRIRKYATKGRWKHSDNFHLTLKFLNEISLNQQLQIDEAIKGLCIEQIPFSLELSDIGIFRGKEYIRVLWLGFSGEIQKLQLLHKRIDKALSPIGFMRESRKFTPHITIGQDIIFKCSFEQIRSELGKTLSDRIVVDRLYLFKSEQINNRRIYSKISEYKFFSN